MRPTLPPLPTNTPTLAPTPIPWDAISKRVQGNIVQIKVTWKEQRVWKDEEGNIWRWRRPLAFEAGYGTGWIVQYKDEQRFIVTNSHVIAPYYTEMEERPADTWDIGSWRIPHSLRITVSNRQDTVGTKILRDNEAADLAILSANGVNIEGEPLRLADPELITVGSNVAIYGYGTVRDPDPYDRTASHIYYADVETGTITEDGAFADQCPDCTVAHDTRKLRISTGVAHGDSGGPVIDTDGNIVGVLYAGNPQMAIAIHGSHIADEMHQAWLVELFED